MAVDHKIEMAAVCQCIGYLMLVHHNDLFPAQCEDVRLVVDIPFCSLLKKEFVPVVVAKYPRKFAFEVFKEFQREW